MSKCRVCGEEIKDLKVCPICGTKVLDIDKTKENPNKINNEQNILQQIDQEKISLIEKCSKSVTKIIKRCGAINYSGTGWVTKDNLVITNAHVICDDNGIYDNDEVLIEFSDKLNLKQPIIRAKVLAYSSVEDIAVLTSLDYNFPTTVPCLEIADYETKQGELVFTIGNPLHYKFTYTEGAVANPHYKTSGEHYNKEILQTTLTLNSGNSGGPVFDTYGKVVGMTTFSELDNNSSEIKGYGFCVKNFTILDTIKEIEGGK